MTPEQRAFLDSQRVARLATVDDAGRPHVVPVCFAHHAGALYIAVDEKPKRGDPAALRRVRNILARPDVSVVADHYEEDWTRLRWLQVRGHAVLVVDTAERAGALAALRAKYPQYRAMALETRPLIRVTPERVVEWTAGGDERTGGGGHG
ncbi:MAG: TIGR03668 family PPOX class F420-dependent oxidoreductase [Chloroflexi bacterium]|nr:TIGR03668 family PPOX class F420-dependent oxidoreductase [Chloroflexota bacterium]MBI4503951.1 TIGR03668 family PPOX class F420-dependent oxidoreductase [Chloroflexota bacterium]